MSRKNLRQAAFLTMGDHGKLKCEDPLAHGALAKRGWEISQVSWHAPPNSWDRFEVVVVRSTWDYHHHVHAFLAVLEGIQRAGVRLENNLALMKWNMNKTYLKELEERGVAIVPTLWGEGNPSDQFADFRRRLDTHPMVIKPCVSASATDTFVIGDGTALSRVGSRFQNRQWMVQPFMEAIVSEGEYSLIYFGGRFSHGVLKTPGSGDFRVQEEFGGTNILVTPPPALIRAADLAMAALSPQPLYARMDMVRQMEKDGDRFCLMEAELIEPTLFFSMDPGAADRFAQAFSRMMDRN